MSWTRITGVTGGTTSSSASLSVTLPVSPQAGDLVIVGVSCDNVQAGSPITSHSFSPIGYIADFVSIALYARKWQNGDANTITIAAQAGTTMIEATVEVFRGWNGVLPQVSDVATANVQSNTTQITVGPTPAVGYSGSLAVAFAAPANQFIIQNDHWTNGFSESQHAVSQTAMMDSAYSILGSSGAVTTTCVWNTTGVNHPVAVLAVFQSSDAPIVDAGPDNATYSGQTYTMQGGATDPNGLSLAYQWTQDSGPNTATFANTASPVSTVTNLIVGTYVFRLTATDTNGAVSARTVTLTVGATPPPQVGAGQDFTLPIDATVQLQGNATDPSNLALTYNWTQISGPNTATITDASAAVTTLTNLAVGEYVFQLTATNTANAASNDRVSVVISPSTIWRRVTGAIAATSTNATTLDVTLPVTPQAGDLVVIFSNSDGALSPIPVTSHAGFTAVASASGTNYSSLNVFCRAWRANDAMTFSVSQTVSTSMELAVEVWRGWDDEIPDANASGLDTSIVTYSVVPSGTTSAIQPKGQLAFAAVGTYQSAATAISGITNGYIVTTHAVATGGNNNGQLLVMPKVLAATEKPQTNVTFASDVNHPIGSMIVFYATDVPARRPQVSIAKRQVVSASGSSSTLSATASDPNSQPLSYQWTLGLNTTQNTADPVVPVLAAPTALTTTLSGYRAGEYAYTLTAINTDGLSASATTRFIVTAETQPILISNTATQQQPAFTLSADVYTPNAAVPTLSWAQVSGPGPVTLATPAQATTTGSAPFGGNYWFTLTATSGSAVTVLRVQVMITNAGPIALRQNGGWVAGTLQRRVSGGWQ